MTGKDRQKFMFCSIALAIDLNPLTFVRMAMNFREMLLSCNILGPSPCADKNHSLYTRPRLLGRYKLILPIFCCSIAILHYDLVPQRFRSIHRLRNVRAGYVLYRALVKQCPNNAVNVQLSLQVMRSLHVYTLIYPAIPIMLVGGIQVYNII